jgi:hypothetical protein
MSGTQVPSRSPRRTRLQPEVYPPALAETLALGCLVYAKRYRDAGYDPKHAVELCLCGLELLHGMPHPLVARDELQSLLARLDPDGVITARIEPFRAFGLQHVPMPPAAHTFLERSVGIDQLLSFPSDYDRFNEAYADAQRCLVQSAWVNEMYIVRYRSRPSSGGDDPCFLGVPAALISPEGPYYLTDICAVLRK